MKELYVPATGPFLMLYRPHGCWGAMLSISGRDITLSAAVAGRGVIFGWRARSRTFRERRWVLGRER